MRPLLLNEGQLLKTVIGFRRRIHQNPELGGAEQLTSDFVFQTLTRAGLRAKRLSPTGVLAWVGTRRGPCVALRADMDALPLSELANFSYRSRIPGVSHACGHDAHTAMLMTAGLALAQDPPIGTVTLMFQPNEEGAGGARQLIRQGALLSPPAQRVFGLHVNPRLPAGTVGVKAGPLMAAVAQFTLEVFGEGGHGAYPHEGADAIVMAARVVEALQSIVSRQTDPVEPVVITVGTIQGGHRYNVLADRVMMSGTVRTLSDGFLKKLPRLIRQAAGAAAATLGGRCELVFNVQAPVLVNDPGAVRWAEEAARQVVGAGRVIPLEKPSMGGEDFAEYVKKVPGAFLYLGTGADARTRRPWHHGAFQLHEPSMAVGVRLLVALARTSLRHLAGRSQSL